MTLTGRNVTLTGRGCGLTGCVLIGCSLPGRGLPSVESVPYVTGCPLNGLTLPGCPLNGLTLARCPLNGRCDVESPVDYVVGAIWIVESDAKICRWDDLGASSLDGRFGNGAGT